MLAIGRSHRSVLFHYTALSGTCFICRRGAIHQSGGRAILCQRGLDGIVSGYRIESTPAAENAMNTPATALRNASFAGNAALVEKLLRAGADPNVADVHGRTALSHAARHGHGTIVDALLAAGAWADPHEDYDVYETPLMGAAEGGHLEIVKKLVQAGANPSFHVGVSQRTAESYARVHGFVEIAKYLSSVKAR